MSIIYSTEGYVLEGKLDHEWKSNMKYGHITLILDSLLFEGGIKEGDISKSNVGENIKILYTDILSVNKTKYRLNHVVEIESYDGKLFTFNMADEFGTGKKKANELYNKLNQAIFEYKKNLAICSKCGKEIEEGQEFCKYCGKKIVEP